MSEPRLPDLARSFERHLRAENKSDRTVETYLEAVRLGPGHLLATGHRPPPTRMPTAPATVDRAMAGERAWHDPPGNVRTAPRKESPHERSASQRELGGLSAMLDERSR